jgi:riboflavin transporter FmnP
MAMSTVDPGITESEAPSQPDSGRVERAFSISVVISGIRCGLTYVIFPWVLPLLGIAGGVGPAIGLIVGVVAIGFNVASIRRFWAADHQWKWAITALNTGVIVLLVVLITLDLANLVG